MKNNTNGCAKKLPRVWQQKLDRVLNVVVDEFGYDDESEIWEQSRVPYRCWARWIVWDYMREMGMSSTQIARYCKRDHATVVHGWGRVSTELRLSPDMRAIYRAINRRVSL